MIALMKKFAVMCVAAVVAGVLTGALLAILPGCALFQPPVAEVPQQAATSQAAQIGAALQTVSSLLEQLKAARQAPAIAIPATQAATPEIAATQNASADKEAQILSLLTASLQKLNTDIQNAPSAQAQQQAAFNTGMQTAQSAAVTFGGQYGALIAAGIGILSVLVQGMVNSSKAHQAAQAANATAQTLAGRIPPAVH